MATTDKKIHFINGFIQGSVSIALQTANAIKTRIADLAKKLNWLSTLYAILSKTFITFAGISILIENILNFKKIIEIQLNPQEWNAAEKNKTYIKTAIGLLNAGFIGLLTAITFGVASAAILAAAIAFPALMAIEIVYGIGEFIYDTWNLENKKAAFEENKEAYKAIRNDIATPITVKEIAKAEAQMAFVELKAAEKNFNYQRNNLLAKTIILAGAIMAIFPPTMLAGFITAATGFAGVVKTGLDQTKLVLEKENTLKSLTQKKEALRANKEDFVSSGTPTQLPSVLQEAYAIHFTARNVQSAASYKEPSVLRFFGDTLDTARKNMFSALPARFTR